MKNDRVKIPYILNAICAFTLAITLSSCGTIISSANRVRNLYLEAEALYSSGYYDAAVEKYKVALKEFGKPGVTLGLRPDIDEDFPSLINSRIAICCSYLVKDIFLEAEELYHQRNYIKSIEKYKAAISEPVKYGIPINHLPNIGEGFPSSALINFRIATCYSKLAEQSDESQVLYSKAVAYIQRAATSKTNDKKYIAESYYFWAILLHKTGQPEQAILKFNKFVVDFPKSPLVEDAFYYIGVFYYKRKEYTISRKAFEGILNKFPSSRFKDEAHYRIAEAFLMTENYEQAYQSFLKVFTSKFQIESRYYAAHCLYQLGRYDKAISQYKTFIKQYPTSQYITALPQYIFSIGKSYFKNNQYDKALSSYQLALQNTENQPLKTEIQLAVAETYLAIGKVYFGKKDYENTLSSYQLALQNTENQPLKTEIQLAMVFAYLNHSDAKNAMDTCKRILSVPEKDPDTMLMVDSTTKKRLTIAKGIQLYLEAENTPFLAGYKGAVAKYNAALIEIQEIISAKVSVEYQSDLNYILGYLFYKVERFESAEKQLTKVIEEFPDSNFVDDARYAIGDMNYKLQSYLECRAAFRGVLDGFPTSDLRDDAQYFIAKSLLEELKYERAHLAFNELTTEDFKKYPDLQDDARYHAAYCLNLLRRDDMAVRWYANFLVHYPKSPYRVNAYFDLGTIYARQQDYENARSNYTSAMQHTDDQALLSELQMAIGHTYYNQGDYKNAIAAHTSLLKRYRESDFIIEAKLGIANSYYRIGGWREAANAYERVINEHPEAVNFIPYCAYQIGEAHYGLATNHSKQGKTKLAVENFHKALKWYQSIIDNLSTETSDDLGEIAELLITSLTRMCNDLNVPEELQSLAQIKKGDTYLAIEQYGKALAEYNTLVQMFPNSTKDSSIQKQIEQVQELIISKNLQPEKVRTAIEIPIAQQIAQKALASTVLIRINDAIGDPVAIGSGFFISKDQIVSNWHVVEGATTAYALSGDEKKRYNITGIIAMNPKQDLVILKVSGEGSPLPLGDSNITQIGETIYVTGNPKGWTGTFSTGVISSFQMDYEGKRIQITAPVSPGSSGGPVLNDKGEVIGIVYALHGGRNAQNLNLAIPVNYLKLLLKRVGPPIPLSAK